MRDLEEVPHHGENVPRGQRSSSSNSSAAVVVENEWQAPAGGLGAAPVPCHRAAAAGLEHTVLITPPGPVAEGLFSAAAAGLGHRAQKGRGGSPSQSAGGAGDSGLAAGPVAEGRLSGGSNSSSDHPVAVGTPAPAPMNSPGMLTGGAAMQAPCAGSGGNGGGPQASPAPAAGGAGGNSGPLLPGQVPTSGCAAAAAAAVAAVGVSAGAAARGARSGSCQEAVEAAAAAQDRAPVVAESGVAGVGAPASPGVASLCRLVAVAEAAGEGQLGENSTGATALLELLQVRSPFVCVCVRVSATCHRISPVVQATPCACCLLRAAHTPDGVIFSG